MNPLGWSQDTWVIMTGAGTIAAIIGALATFIYTSLTLIILGFLIWQSRELSRTRKLTLLTQLVEEFKKANDARGRLYDAYCENPRMFSKEKVSKLPSNFAKDCRDVIINISDFGAMINRSLIEKDFAKDWLHIVRQVHYLRLEGMS